MIILHFLLLSEKMSIKSRHDVDKYVGIKCIIASGLDVFYYCVLKCNKWHFQTIFLKRMPPDPLWVWTRMLVDDYTQPIVSSF